MDHQVNGQKILPGAAYLEMIRAAVEKAMPSKLESTILELRNVVWAQTIIVKQPKQVTIALFASDEEINNGRVEYEVYSIELDEAGNYQETIHCQGQAEFVSKSDYAKIDIKRLNEQMSNGRLEASDIYSTYKQLGINFGLAHQALTVIYKGNQQVLAQLCLPASMNNTQSDYLLHPSIVDGALQAAIGLIADFENIPNRPSQSLPFALESLCVLSPCTKDMFAWVRYSQGSKQDGEITKLDIDLCDQEGNVCAQLRGFSSRVISMDVSSGKEQEKNIGKFFAVPEWESVAITEFSKTNQLEYAQRHIVLCGFANINEKSVEALIPQSRCINLQATPGKNISERYNEVALSCFEIIQKILRDRPLGKILVQVVIANNPNSYEENFFMGLSGLLKTATIENPQFAGQIIFTKPQITNEKLVEQLQKNKTRPQDTIIEYGLSTGTRHVLKLKEIQANQDNTGIVFKDHGVYLITGGLGGLGILFTKEILKQTKNARVLLTGRSELTIKKQAILDELTARDRHVVYKELDIADLDQVSQLIITIKKEYKHLNGIIHSAGMISDNFILKKTIAEFSQVLIPKVTGTFNLDQASKNIDLDFMVLFSSGAALTGNNGQSDYATANGFMDQFAGYRNQLVAAKKRLGKTLSINWPLWQEGGMGMDQLNQEIVRQSSGMLPMQTQTGINSFYQCLMLQHDQILVVEGDVPQLRQTLIADKTIQLEPKPIISTVEQPMVAEIDAKSLEEKTQDYLRKQFSMLLKLPPHKIDPQAPLEKYGIDSILAMNLTSQLEKTFGFLSKTLFFEYQTIRELAEYFIKSHSDKLVAMFATSDIGQKKTTGTQPETIPQIQPSVNSGRRVGRSRHVLAATNTAIETSAKKSDPIAIVGLSGRYPEAINIQEFWNNLRAGKDCIIEVPRERWDWREYYSEDRTKSGHHYSKWGGFISGVDEFDPRFFNISPREAGIIDPQERLFLQHAWMAVEDAGYTRASLQIHHDPDLAGQVGVYVGVMYGEYQLFGAQASVQGKRMGIGSSYASIANRVSYILNLHGPSMTLDTMCSSSLTAIHLACQDLKQGRTSLAIAGGVNISIHPNKYLLISAGQFISSDGHCQSFGEGGDGYIPGEGVGAVILKRLSEAIQDGNHIYGIIKSSVLNHGGKTNGYSVPNPQAQTSMISRALAESDTNPRHISYIEAHGTGTKLGDPIEITSLSHAFQKHTQDTGFCLIGSAKSNIGHCESAAGIAGLTKVLLQMQHQQIVPSLHSAVLNPYIDFQKTPFIVNQTLKTWDQPVIDGKPQPRIAGLSSFGAGGSNAHLIIQEYILPTDLNYPNAINEQNAEVIIPLSARTSEQLKQKANDLLNFIRTSQKEEKETPSCKPIDLVAMAYTLQVGREAMDERLGLTVNSIDQLTDKLQTYINGESDIEGTYQGQVTQKKGSISLFNNDADFQETIEKWIVQKKLSKLLELWVNGLELDWHKLYGEIKPPLISLPAYPFAKERYWADFALAGKHASTGKTTAVLHPLLHINNSDLSQMSYGSTFNGEEFFLTDHQVDTDVDSAQKVFPAAAYLEMARAAVEKALIAQQKSNILELSNIVWGQPVVVKGNKQINIALFSIDSNKVEYEIFSKENEQEIVHCQGEAAYNIEPAPVRIDIENLKGQMKQDRLEAVGLYQFFSTIGLHYGPAHQCITSLYKAEKQLLAQLCLPTVVEKDQNEFFLHPSLIDSAVQASICLFADFNQHKSRPFLPFSLDALRVMFSCTKEMYVWVRYAQGCNPENQGDKLDIDLCDQKGNVCVRMRGLSLKQIAITTANQDTNKLSAPEDIFHLPLPSYDGTLGINQTSQKISIAYSIEQLQQTLRTSLAEALYLNPSEIDIDKSFIDLGLDSIVGVEWVKEINKKFGLEVSSTKIYDYSNVKALASYLAKEIETLQVSSILDSTSIFAHEISQNISLQKITTVTGIANKPSLQLSDSKEAAKVASTVANKPQSIHLSGLQETSAASTIVNKPQSLKLGDSLELAASTVNTAIKENIPPIDLSKEPVYPAEDALAIIQSSQQQKLVYTKEQMQQALRTSLAEALYLKPNEIDIDKPFIDLGLDSIVGVEWVKEINKKFDLNISSTKIYDYSNIRELSSFLEKELKENQSASTNKTLLRSMQEVYTVTDTIANNMQISSVDVSQLSNTTNRPLSVFTKEQVQQALRVSLAEALYLKQNEIDTDKPFIDLGLDSIVGVEWVKEINKQFGLDMSSTKIYDYSNLRELASFLAKELENMPVSFVEEVSSSAPLLSIPVSKTSIPLLSSFPNLKRKLRAKPVVLNSNVYSDDKIAIIGMSGRYPQANNLAQYWDNLAAGKNSITEIPKTRWDIDQYYDPDHTKKGKMYCKWLGMLDDVDCFDPLFFQISPSEAASMDPQHRLFLQESFKAFEDAGYSNSTLSNKKCGVYLGIMSSEYSILVSKSKSNSINITGNSFSIGAARLSYFLNLKGPAIPIDTACSSSLVAIHVACKGLLNHETDMALAGGVSLYLIPESYMGMCQAGMLSPEGQCKTFDDSANGFVPGEGVGALVLKRLKDAERDNDFIYGVILGSGVNQDGKTNGITAPSVNSQIELERDLYSRYKIDPETISYVEAHGTGTKLGDPIELEALSTAFKEKTSKKNYCALGSVKSNIGHTSGAAGVASVQKVLLSMQHKTLVPSLNVTKENTIFDFKNSPFYISREKQSWDVGTGSLRRASVSSFGFSGTNAHLVIEEYPQQIKDRRHVSVITQNPEVIIPLSARTADQLKQKVHDLLDFTLKNEQSIDLIGMAYTLQTGRDGMKERLGFIVSSVGQLAEKLKAHIGGVNNIENFYQGQVTRDKDNLSIFGTDDDLQKIIDKWINGKKFPKLLDLWVKGLELDWNKLYVDYKPQRISLPTYPFAKERYWIDLPMDTATSQKSVSEIKVESAQEVEEKMQQMHYHPLWKETAISVLSESGNKPLVTGPILVLDTTDELYLVMKKQLEESVEGNLLIFVKLDHAYQEIGPSIFTINPEQEEHFYQLAENLKAKGQLPRQIIHQGLGSELLEKKEQIVQQLNYSLYTLFNLCKALMKQKNQMSLQILSLFSSNGSVTAPQNAALGSFFKTLTLENPNYHAKVIEIQNDFGNPEISILEKAGFVLDEFRNKNWNKNEIRYKFHKEKQIHIRYVRELTPFTPAHNSKITLPLKQRGVYIVSGGLGGLGFIFSEYLVKNFQCKLVLFGRSALKAEQEVKLNQLKTYNTEILYLQADVSKLEDIEVVVKTTKARFSEINGVIHSAGVNNDSFIFKKSKEEIKKVLEPKIYGAINLDLATREENLDVFILFSSIASIMGNLGQCDYAYGNRFLDSFAEKRESLKKEQKRFGKTISINWPFWEEGGMILSQDEIALAKKQTGICPLPTKVGIQYLEEFLQSGLSQCVALFGFSSKIKAYVSQEPVRIDKIKQAPTSTMDPAMLLEKTEAYLKTLIGEVIKLDPERIDSRERFESFGIDSIIISQINVNLEKDLGALSKTLFYEYSTIEELAAYLTQEARQALLHVFNLENSTNELEIQTIENDAVTIQEAVQVQKKYEDSESIAIIGVHGTFPQSEDLDEYWENLKLGKDLVDLVPATRWDYKEFYHSDPEKAAEGKIYCKWGGFINDVDKFDPLFFNISPEEAKIMDPQERLFLESVWAAIEDAGYTRDSLKKRYPRAKSADVGVFVGVTTNTYNLLAAEEWSRGNLVTPSAVPWSIANRVSYFFDFQGPSMPVDTACSSSLVAIHLACESLKKQECQVAIAGGVNLYLHPSKYHSFCKRRMVSLNGKCSSFGAGDDGFVPGEGVGTVILKPLSKAIEDQDHIYAVIAGSAVNHSGRSNGYSAPNPNSQADLIGYTLSKANINPETIGYIEGHGTGTQIGDNLEIVALTNAFQKQTTKKQYCPVGSVKANIGHSESAAGIASVAKILLQMKHKQLVPSINSEEVNPNIEFKDSPFYLQHELTQWKSSPQHPRRALINAFGAGGVNASVILEEYEKPKVPENSQETGPYLVILSARNEERLRECVNRLLLYLGKQKYVNLTNLSYTLQNCREAMQERLAIVVSEKKELIDRLKDWKQQKLSANVYRGTLDPRRVGKKSLKKDEVETRDLVKLAEIWSAGAEVDWENLYPQNKPVRIALPTYPFAKERYWVSERLVPEKRTGAKK
jgi:acyl transferase domain-containing protein/acyl carrier protein